MVDTDGDGAREAHLLLEGEARANAFTFPRDLTNAAWGKFATTASLAATGVDGAFNAASALMETTANSSHAVTRASPSFTANTPQSISVCVKPNGRTRGRLYLYTSGGTSYFGVTFDLAAGAVTNLTAGTGSVSLKSIEPLANGFWRVTASGKPDAPSASGTVQLDFLDANGNAIYAGDTSKGLIVDGFQFEVDKPFSSSLILSGSRVSEALSFPFQVPPCEMTVYVDAVWRVAPNPATNYVGFMIGDYLAGSKAYFLGRLSGSLCAPHAQHSTNGGGIISSSDAVVAVPYGHRAETRHVLRADGATLGGMSLDGAPESVTGYSTPIGLAQAWGAATIRIGTDGSQPGSLAVRSVRIAAGIQSLTYMREL